MHQSLITVKKGNLLPEVTYTVQVHFVSVQLVCPCAVGPTEAAALQCKPVEKILKVCKISNFKFSKVKVL